MYMSKVQAYVSAKIGFVTYSPKFNPLAFADVSKPCHLVTGFLSVSIP